MTNMGTVQGILRSSSPDNNELPSETLDKYAATNRNQAYLSNYLVFYD